MNEGKQMYADLMNLLVPVLPSNIHGDVRRVQTLAWALVGLCLTHTVRSRCRGRNGGQSRTIGQ